jgi:hypothetical protein
MVLVLPPYGAVAPLLKLPLYDLGLVTVLVLPPYGAVAPLLKLPLCDLGLVMVLYRMCCDVIPAVVLPSPSPSPPLCFPRVMLGVLKVEKDAPPPPATFVSAPLRLMLSLLLLLMLLLPQVAVLFVGVALLT